MALLSDQEFWQGFEGTYADFGTFISAAQKRFNDNVAMIPPDRDLQRLQFETYRNNWIKNAGDGSKIVKIDSSSTRTDQSSHQNPEVYEGMSMRDRFMIPWVFSAVEKAIGATGVSMPESDLYDAVVFGIKAGAAEYQSQLSGRSGIPNETEGQ